MFFFRFIHTNKSIVFSKANSFFFQMFLFYNFDMYDIKCQLIKCIFCYNFFNTFKYLLKNNNFFFIRILSLYSFKLFTLATKGVLLRIDVIKNLV